MFSKKITSIFSHSINRGFKKISKEWAIQTISFEGLRPWGQVPVFRLKWVFCANAAWRRKSEHVNSWRHSRVLSWRWSIMAAVAIARNDWQCLSIGNRDTTCWSSSLARVVSFASCFGPRKLFVHVEALRVMARPHESTVSAAQIVLCMWRVLCTADGPSEAVGSPRGPLVNIGSRLAIWGSHCDHWAKWTCAAPFMRLLVDITLWGLLRPRLWTWVRRSIYWCYVLYATS